MKNRFEELCEILKQDNRFVDDNGVLLKNKIQECSSKLDVNLLRLLYANDYSKSLFFTMVDDIPVFDKVKFNWVIDSQDFLPNSYTAYKNSVMLVDEYGTSVKKNKDVVLEFPNKDCVLEMDSTAETDNRQEVFLNEVLMKSEVDTLLAPKAFANAKKYDVNGVHTTNSIDDTDNLIIKGNNLLALHSLLPRYKGQIKLMYWDILYNTDNDQVPYNDSFKHSSWLVMMKNRLEIAQKLLKDDGVICLQCDDNEQAYLKVLCDEVFGRENFINCIVVKMSEATGVKMTHVKTRLPKLKEYILVYKKEKECNIDSSKILIPIEKIGINYKSVITGISDDKIRMLRNLINKDIVTDEDVIIFDNISKNVKLLTFSEVNKNWDTLTDDEKENWKKENAYRIVRETSSASAKKNADIKRKTTDEDYFGIKTSKNKLYFIKNHYNENTTEPNIKLIFAIDYLFTNPCDLWVDIKTTRIDLEGYVGLKNGKKPEKLLYKLISMFTDENDIVLDAYLGSGTTAAVAHKLNRHYIGIEQLDSHSKMELERMQSVIDGEQSGISKSVNWNGGGSFVFCELAKNGQEVLDRIDNSSNTEELIEIYNELKKSDFVLYRVDIDKMEKEKNGFLNLYIDDKKKFLRTIIDKNTLYINYSDIENADYNISDEDKAFTRSFYKED